MKALIEVATNKILSLGNATHYGGPWGKGIEDGVLRVVNAPNDERLDELICVAGVVQVDAAKKAARIAKKQDTEAKLEKLLKLKKSDLQTAGAPDLDKMCDAILDVAKAVRRMAKGD